MSRQITLTDDELAMVAYALSEMGNRRQEQSIECRGAVSREACLGDARIHWALSHRLREHAANARHK